MSDPTPLPRVLRGITPEPYTFDQLGANGEVVVAPTPLAPAPPPEALEDAYERGRKDGLRERQDEVAALQEETVRLAQSLKEGIEDQKAFVQHTADRLCEQWTSALKTMEPTLAAIAIDVAEAVLEAPSPTFSATPQIVPLRMLWMRLQATLPSR